LQNRAICSLADDHPVRYLRHHVCLHQAGSEWENLIVGAAPPGEKFLDLGAEEGIKSAQRTNCGTNLVFVDPSLRSVLRTPP